MKIREILESKEGLDKDAVAAIPNAHYFPDLDNSSPYHSYRLGIAMAGAPDYTTPKDGPSGQKLVTIGYSSACDEIVKSASKMIGAKAKKLTSKGSKEDNTTGSS